MPDIEHRIHLLIGGLDLEIAAILPPCRLELFELLIGQAGIGCACHLLLYLIFVACVSYGEDEAFFFPWRQGHRTAKASARIVAGYVRVAARAPLHRDGIRFVAACSEKFNAGAIMSLDGQIRGNIA